MVIVQIFVSRETFNKKKFNMETRVKKKLPKSWADYSNISTTVTENSKTYIIVFGDKPEGLKEIAWALRRLKCEISFVLISGIKLADSSEVPWARH